jgi:N-acetylneuraminic acid mutarotase
MRWNLRENSFWESRVMVKISYPFGMRRALAAVFIAASILLALSPAARAQRRWVKAAPLPETSEEFSTIAANGKIYLIGGNPTGNTGAPRGLVQEYDPATDTWASKKPMPIPTHHAAIAEYQGKIYVMGGAIQRAASGPNQFPTNNAWEYDPTEDSWKALPPMPTSRMAAVAAEAGGKIYVIGGASVHPGHSIVSLSADVPHRSLDTNEMYDPATNQWETRSPMPTARNHAAAGVVGGKIYVIGGRLGAVSLLLGSNTDVVEHYDPVTDRWGTAGLRMPIARSGMGWATYQDRIYIAGGEILDAHMFAAIRAVEAYDPATNQWALLPTMPTARHGVNVAVVKDRLYVIGGHLQGGFLGGEGANSNANDVFEFAGR